MSAKHPIISVTGLQGAGENPAHAVFDKIFKAAGVNAAFVEGDAFLRYDRSDMRTVMQEEADKGNSRFSRFGPEANRLEDLESLLKQFGAYGRGRIREYVRDEMQAAALGAPAGSFTDWREIPHGTDLLLYTGLHGAAVTDTVDIARLCDLKIGLAPSINLEWAQKSRREGGGEEARRAILRRTPDYARYICPQFSATDVNFQRVPTVDTCDPFAAPEAPGDDETIVIVRPRNPQEVDFLRLLAFIKHSYMSRADTLVIPGGKLGLAMQLILTPMVQRMLDRRKGRR